MRVLVACEFSGAVRDAFTELGHDAMSCDILPSETPGPHHQGDVLPLLREPWDLVVAHPPCTFLTNSGARWLYDHRYPRRWQDMVDGAVFFRACLNANAPAVAVENPKMHGWAAKIVGTKPSQYVEPWMFGHPETKQTGLWLRGLPPLLATEDVRGVMEHLPIKERNRIHWAPASKNRGKVRSVTYAGLARAMAEQWGGDVREVAA